MVDFTNNDLSSPTKLGKKVMSEVGAICNIQFKQSIQEVLEKTPKSQLIQMPSSVDKKMAKRKIVRETKQTIQKQMDENDTQSIMANRISWSAYDRMRKSSLQDNKTRKRSRGWPDDEIPTPKRKHGGSLDDIDTQQLLEQARHWSSQEKVNWSELARQYGLKQKNGGQTLKDLLKQHDIPVAQTPQRGNRAPRCQRLSLAEGIKFPMSRPISYHKHRIQNDIQSGRILQGEKVLETTHDSFTVATDRASILWIVKKISARRIS